jgi:hypothetical protein
MAVGLIIFFIILIGCIIRYSTESKPEAPDPVPIKHISEYSVEELNAELSKLETEIEMQKIKYQGALSNPQVWPVTRDLIKNNLESMLSTRQAYLNEINKRNNY